MLQIIGAEVSDQTVQTQIRLLLWEQSDQVSNVCHASCSILEQ